MEHRVGTFLLSFDTNITHQTHADEHSHGISFFASGKKYEVVECLLGTRLIINSTVEFGHLQDMPFHEGTSELLPSGIRTRRI